MTIDMRIGEVTMPTREGRSAEGEGRVDIAVIGGGIVGLSTGVHLVERFRGAKVVVLEKEASLAAHQTGHNSGVIHSGLYYKPGSLKAKLCVEGAARLYTYAGDRGIPHKRCGKIIVATAADQVAKLAEFGDIGRRNGVAGLRTLTPAEVTAMEPEVACVAALHSPNTGIIDVHAYMLALQADAEAAGATVVLRAPVISGQVVDGGFALDIGGASPSRIGCRMLVKDRKSVV